MGSVLGLELGKSALSVPGPRGVSSKEEVHVLQRALVGFWIECPHHGDSDGVAYGKDVQSLLSNGIEHHRAE